jgi:hypothetical protein
MEVVRKRILALKWGRKVDDLAKKGGRSTPEQIQAEYEQHHKRKAIAAKSLEKLEKQMATLKPELDEARPVAMSRRGAGIHAMLGGSGGGIQAATAAAAATQPPPAKNKRMRATRDAATDDEEVEGARVPAAAASGRAPAAAEDDSLRPRSLYECIELASEGSEHASTILNISVDVWIEVYKSDKQVAFAAWADMAMRAAGTKLTKAFKHGLGKLVETLLEKVKHEILFDEVLMPWLLERFVSCSQVHASAQHGAQHGA